MKKLYIFLSCSVFTISVFAQAVPVLPKEWKGEISATSMGVAHKTAAPNQAASGWNRLTQTRDHQIESLQEKKILGFSK
jgi:hypothetical protein